MAYLVGLMASDGCLSKDGRHLDLTSIDLEQLDNFGTAIGRPITISRKKNGRGGYAFRAQLSDVRLYDFLLEAGLTPNKSLTLEEVSVPDIFYSDFLRGLLDGDGSVYGYNDPRWPSSFVFYTCFSAANLAFLEFLRSTNSRLLGTSLGSIRTSTRVYVLAYGKTDSKILYHHMYVNKPGRLSLTRKRLKLEGFLSR